jgi:hypothetical protein
MMRRNGVSVQTGSGLAASPVSAKAWQRQPPKSTAFRGQVRQGSFIHESPRNAWNPGGSCQIHRSECSRTVGKESEVMLFAAWQGRAWPLGLTTMYSFPQPP